MLDTLNYCCGITENGNDSKLGDFRLDYDKETKKLICPNCKYEEDKSEHIIEIEVAIEEENSFIITKNPEMSDDELDSLSDDLNIQTDIDSMDLGEYSMHVYWLNYDYMTDCGIEYDSDCDILWYEKTGD
jgi:hypothetical protein